MLVGRVLALGLNLVSQIIIVRYLAKSDYGAFAYVYSLVMLFKGLALLGLPDTVVRYLPLYRERAEPGSILGTLAFSLGVVAGVGALLAIAFITVFASGASWLTNDPSVAQLALVLAFLIPLEALNELLTPVFAVFTHYRAIFFRKWILAPALRFGVVVTMVILDAGVLALASGYLVASAIGVAVYLRMLSGVARAEMWNTVPRRAYHIELRELLTFAGPVLVTGLVWLVIESTDAILLGWFHSAQAVAEFRAVMPISRLTQVVILSFAVVYTPLAARAFARDDTDGITDLYWQSAAWICVLTFPVFLLTCPFAAPLTTLLFGERYAGAAPVMALLSLAYFIPSALGFNGATLKVYRKLRYSLAIDCGAASANFVLSLLLIPLWGPVGAAAATCATMVIYNALRQYGLGRFTPVTTFPRSQVRLYLSMLIVAAALFGTQAWLRPGIGGVALLTAAGSAMVGLVALRTLRLESTFPELLRVPMLRTLLRPFMGPA